MTLAATGSVPARSAPARRSVLLIARIILPFAAGYHLSYLFRTINALIAPALISEIPLEPDGLGLLTSAYFLPFAILQLPLGVILDRYGPRRTQAVLMAIAALGAAIFGMGQSAIVLFIGRAVIGVGAAGALMAGLKAIALWFPRERLASLNGWLVMLGTTGAISATAPSEMLLGQLGWRGLFIVLAITSLIIGLCIYLLVPDAANAEPSAPSRPPPALWAIYTDPRFLRIALLSTTCMSAVWAIQGLWAARWLADVDQMPEPFVVDHLFVMACALSVGAVLFGMITDWLRRGGVSFTVVFGGAALAFMAVEALIVTRAPLSPYVSWGAFAAFGALTVLSYTILGQLYPAESLGRVNSALNVLHIGGALVMQSTIGIVISAWPMDAAGSRPDASYQAAFGLPLLLQAAALLWFAWPRTERGAGRNQGVREMGNEHPSLRSSIDGSTEESQPAFPDGPVATGLHVPIANLCARVDALSEQLNRFSAEQAALLALVGQMVENAKREVAGARAREGAWQKSIGVRDAAALCDDGSRAIHASPDREPVGTVRPAILAPVAAEQSEPAPSFAQWEIERAKAKFAVDKARFDLERVVAERDRLRLALKDAKSALAEERQTRDADADHLDGRAGRRWFSS